MKCSFHFILLTV